MKKLALFFLLATGTTALCAQPDSLDYRSDYYSAKRAQQERVAVQPQHTVMLGNSLTERGAWADLLQDSLVVNRGIGGDCVAGMTARLGAIVAGKPRALSQWPGAAGSTTSTSGAGWSATGRCPRNTPSTASTSTPRATPYGSMSCGLISLK